MQRRAFGPQTGGRGPISCRTRRIGRSLDAPCGRAAPFDFERRRGCSVATHDGLRSSERERSVQIGLVLARGDSKLAPLRLVLYLLCKRRETAMMDIAVHILSKHVEANAI
jgi:hypothetical protein